MDNKGRRKSTRMPLEGKERRQSMRATQGNNINRQRKSMVAGKEGIAFTFKLEDLKAKQKKPFRISCLGFACFIFQLLNLHEIACILISIHVFRQNNLTHTFGFAIFFFLTSKFLKIIYFARRKSYRKCIMVIFCLDYLAVYLSLQKERSAHQEDEKIDQNFRKDWIESKKTQQSKIDQYIQKLQPEVIKEFQSKPSEYQKKLEQRQKQKKKKQIPNSNDTTLNTIRNQRYTYSTQVNHTEQGTYQVNNALGNNSLFIHSGGKLLQTDTQLKNSQFSQFGFQQTQQSRVNYGPQNNFYLTTEGASTNNQNTETFKSPKDIESQRRLPKQQLQQPQFNLQQILEGDQINSPTKINKSLIDGVQSSLFKKFNLSSEQLNSLILSKFKIIYIEDDTNPNQEQYFINRKFLVSAMRIVDGITVSAPLLYIVSSAIANNFQTLPERNLLYICYWSFAICLSISITLLLNLQLIPFRQHASYFYIQLKAFFKDFLIIFSTSVSCSIIWGLSSINAIVLGVYEGCIYFIMVHQVYFLLRKIYYEQIRQNSQFKHILLAVSFFLTIFVGCLQIFSNLVLIINPDLIQEALLQLRDQLKKVNPKIKRDDLFKLEEKMKIGERFIKRQNLFFVFYMLSLLIMSIFVNDIQNVGWNHEIMLLYKLLIGFIPISIIALIHQIQDIKFLRSNLTDMVYVHINRVTNSISQIKQQIQVQQDNLKILNDEYKLIEKFKMQLLSTEQSIEEQMYALEEEDKRLRKDLSQGKTDKNELQKLTQVNLRLQELRYTRTDLKLQIQEQKVPCDKKANEIKSKENEIKQLGIILNNISTYNGIPLEQ